MPAGIAAWKILRCMRRIASCCAAQRKNAGTDQGAACSAARTKPAEPESTASCTVYHSFRDASADSRACGLADSQMSPAKRFTPDVK